MTQGRMDVDCGAEREFYFGTSHARQNKEKSKSFGSNITCLNMHSVMT